MPGMKRLTILIVAAIAAFAPVGCGPGGGLLIRPVPTRQDLDESVVAPGKGLWVADRLAIVEVDGLLMNRREPSLLGAGENPVSLFVEKLDTAAADKRVCGLILRVNSPGGGVTASDIMYERVMRFRRERGIPVVAVLNDVAASGGYYVACAADTIIAQPTSITGSIGVIVQTVSLDGTLRKLGISAEAITSGPYKDMASPLKPLSDDDRQVLQGIVDQFYERFVTVVAAGRPELTKAQVIMAADGRVYTGDQALEVGLVDRVGTLDDAIELLRERTGRPRAKVVMYHRPLGYRGTAYAAGQVPAPRINLNLLNISGADLSFLTRPQFLYLWSGRSARR